MANEIMVYSERERDQWRKLLDETEEVTRYRIENRSDYTGKAYAVMWDEVTR